MSEEERIAYPEIAEELVKMGEEDQRVLKEAIAQGKDKVFEQVRDNNTDKLREIISSIGWPTVSKVGERAAYQAWLIVQHSDQDTAFQEGCLDLLKGVPQGEVNIRNIAYLEDRVRKNLGLPQIYGTQVGWEIEDEENVDKRRAELGMEPVEVYIKKTKELYENLRKEKE